MQSGRSDADPTSDELPFALPAKGSAGTPRAFLAIYLRGTAMGAADIVPGVSGGTMALILGIYERLILSLRSLARAPFLTSLLKGRFGAAMAAVDGLFLLALAAGIATSVIALSRLLSAWLEARPVFVHAFFFGLILASVLLVARRIERPSAGSWALFTLGAVTAYLVVGLTPTQTPEAPWFLFLSGALAVSALLLPGISGAFVLVLLGKYAYVLDAVNRADLTALGSVAAGAVAGMLSFAQVLGWLFRRYHDATLALLCGVMLGSLRKVWPWQAEREGVSVNLAPRADAWSTEHGWAWALLLALAGALLVTLLERAGRERESDGASDEGGARRGGD
jgi:putative membrane protein